VCFVYLTDYSERPGRKGEAAALAGAGIFPFPKRARDVKGKASKQASKRESTRGFACWVVSSLSSLIAIAHPDIGARMRGAYLASNRPASRDPNRHRHGALSVRLAASLASAVAAGRLVAAAVPSKKIGANEERATKE